MTLRSWLFFPVWLLACSPGAGQVGSPADAGPGEDLMAAPLQGASQDQIDRFYAGEERFHVFFIDVGGLGPLYIRKACSACHDNAGRGPGSVEKMVLVGADGITPLADQSPLAYGHTVRPYVAAGATTPIVPPIDLPSLKLTQRGGPPIFGRGYMEAVADSEIERVEAEQAARTDGISGRINRVTFHSEANPGQTVHTYQPGQGDLIGRFGLKARIATLDDFTADAFQGDMGITSPMRPAELPNPDGLTDDGKPGVDTDFDTLNVVSDFTRLVEIPRRTLDPKGAALFSSVNCDVCHVPSLATRSDYPIALLAGIDAPVYTDFLLHDMGEWLADGLVDESATGQEWRTAPLIGLRFLKTYLHDNSASTLKQAVLMHEAKGSEANESIALFRSLSSADQAALLSFVGSL
jgi:CxxC motif-containing protein (DUF1111 family)